MGTSGQLGDGEVAAFEMDAARRHSREERWRRVRSLRLKSWFFPVLWPFAVLVIFVACEIGIHSFVQLVPGLNQHDGAVYGIALQIATCILFVAAGVYVIFSPRNNAWIRRLGRRGPWGLPRQPMQKAKYHARYCAARNRGTAAVFLVYSSLEVFQAWRNLSKPLPSHTQLMFLIEGLLVPLVVLVYLFLYLTCFRERLAIVFGAAALVVRLVVAAAAGLATPHTSAICELSLLLWASAALASLALLKSALRAPPPGTIHL